MPKKSEYSFFYCISNFKKSHNDFQLKLLDDVHLQVITQQIKQVAVWSKPDFKLCLIEEKNYYHILQIPNYEFVEKSQPFLSKVEIYILTNRSTDQWPESLKYIIVY